jgi:hypothetical protein
MTKKEARARRILAAWLQPGVKAEATREWLIRQGWGYAVSVTDSFTQTMAVVKDVAGPNGISVVYLWDEERESPIWSCSPSSRAIMVDDRERARCRRTELQRKVGSYGPAERAGAQNELLGIVGRIATLDLAIAGMPQATDPTHQRVVAGLYEA